ncbi:ABC transporter permease [Cryptosporangium arvum]|uniref:ABC transporter permease n=1 Tax=Cryptosporangium arvum TaxID=80871 RepID=UPI0004BC9F0A|nr:ABC transporter permease [Cryptosporangium arvum]
MSDVVSSQWLVLRSVRSTAWLLGSLLLLLAGCWGAGTLMVSAWDAASPADRALFESADMTVISGPLAQLVLGIVGVLAVTAEYRTGSITTTLTAVPNRLRLLGAKTLVVAGLATAAALVVAVGSVVLSLQIAGDRPAPIDPWTSAGDMVGTGAANMAVCLAAALTGVGLGAALRSSAGAVMAVAGLLFVAPVIAVYLPDPWDTRIASVLPSSLAAQLSGDDYYSLGVAGAVCALVAYPLVALTAGGLTLLKRDA